MRHGERDRKKGEQRKTNADCDGPVSARHVCFNVISGCSGGAGNRTPVRASIRNHVYVCMPCLRSPPAGAGQPCRRTISLSSRVTRGRNTLHQPDFAILRRRLRRAATGAGALSWCYQLKQPLPVQNWQLNLSKRFSQGLGPGHAAIPSSNPSKPIAPVARIVIGSCCYFKS